jgi:hypothetical protein
LISVWLVSCDSPSSNQLPDPVASGAQDTSQDLHAHDAAVQATLTSAPIDSFLLSADSVILTSFAGNVTYAPVDSVGLLNRQSEFVKYPLEKKVLTRNQIVELNEVIFGPPYKSVSTAADCYNPHHSIYVYHDKSECDLEICFECSGIRTCKELHGRLPVFHDQRWQSLEKLFKEFGIKKNIPS